MDSNVAVLLTRLRQTCEQLEKLSSNLGGYGDTPDLRKRLSALEASARDGVRDVEKAILDSKLRAQGDNNQASQRAMIMVEDQFVVDKKSAQAVLDRLAARRKAAGSRARLEGVPGAPPPAAGGGGGGGTIVIEMKNLTAVDAHIAEVRARAAAAAAAPPPRAAPPPSPPTPLPAPPPPPRPLCRRPAPRRWASRRTPPSSTAR